jgi:hypothetical protein
MKSRQGQQVSTATGELRRTKGFSSEFNETNEFTPALINTKDSYSTLQTIYQRGPLVWLLFIPLHTQKSPFPHAS